MGPGSTTARADGSGRGLRRALWVALCSLAVGVGALLIALGGFLIVTAHPATTVEIDGSIADYTEILIGGSYARNELRLADDNHTYTLDAPQFHPPLPERFLREGKVQIWVTQGTTTVVAVTLYDQLGLNPTNYATDVYDHPVRTMVEAEMGGAAASVVGLAMIVVAFVLLRKGRLPRRKPAPPKPEPMPVAMGVRVGADDEPGQRYQASPWDLTLFGGDKSSGPPPSGEAPDGIDQLPTRKTPAVFPGVADPSRQTAPPASAPPAPDTSIGIDQFPTQKTPAVPTLPPMPLAPEGDSTVRRLGPQEPFPASPAPPAPDREDLASGGILWGAVWGVQPTESDEPHAGPSFQPPTFQPDAPKGEAPSAPPGQRTPTAPPARDSDVEDVEDLPTQRTPAVQPPQGSPGSQEWWPGRNDADGSTN
jgi:hypothetical protein